MSETKKSDFQFVDFIINKSVFNFKQSYDEINITINPSGKLFKKDKKFELSLEVIVFDKSNNNEELIQILCTSTFLFSEDVEDKNSISSYFLINAPAIAFPYIRAYLSSLTVQSGKQALVLPTFNLSALADNLKENLTFTD